MKKVLIIPNLNDLGTCVQLAEQYNLGFEYNEFFSPKVLDDAAEQKKIINTYKSAQLPAYMTLHGAFFDVIPFSVDPKITEIATLRIEQSITIAKDLGAKAVVFHTNYNPFLNTPSYIAGWVETNIAYWSKVLEAHPNMNIYLENMFDTTPDILEALSKGLCRYDNYGVALDYAHASLSQTAPIEWCKRLAAYIKHVHINDNDKKSDLHLAWGDGCLDREQFYDCYNKYMQGATVLIETSSIDNIKRSLEVFEKEGFL